MTTSQIFQVGTIVFGAVFGAWGLLDPLHSQIAAALSVIVIPAWGGIGAVLTGQAATVREVAAMPGVEKIQTNNQANSALISVAADLSQPKVELPK